MLDLIAGLSATSVKIEFQGGEPTLRCNLIATVIGACARFERAEFVICTNLARLDDDILALFDRPDAFISTSLDGGAETHRRHRTRSDAATAAFATNLDLVLDRYGPDKVSALPTIDPAAPPPIGELIQAYASRGLSHIPAPDQLSGLRPQALRRRARAKRRLVCLLRVVRAGADRPQLGQPRPRA